MTQQPYQQPYPPQQYAAPPAQPQQAYPPQFPGYPQQAAPAPMAPAYPPQPPYQQPYAPPVQTGPPAAPLADGSLDAFYSQPNTGGGPGVSWKGKPDGYTVQGLVPRDVTNADVTQEVGAPNTQEAGRPQFYRDGRPKFVMAVPLQVMASAEYPEGEARLFVRGQLRDELARAMGEAGVDGAPKAGAVITITLVQRKQGRGAIPQNVFAVRYTPAGGAVPPVQQPQAPAPQQAQQYQPPVQQVPAQPPVQQYQPPVQQAYAPTVDQTIAQQAAQGQMPPQWAQQAPAPDQATQGQPQQQVPSDFTADQAALMAKLTGQGAA